MQATRPRSLRPGLASSGSPSGPRWWLPLVAQALALALTLFATAPARAEDLRAGDGARQHQQDTPGALTAMIGQLLIVGFIGAEPGDAAAQDMLRELAEGRIGGVLLLDRNIRSAEQVRRLTAAIRAAGAPYPPFVAVDQEGGAVQRLGPDAGFAPVPGAREVARLGADTGQAFQVYAGMAAALADAGVNLNLGPVVDLALAGGGVIGGLGRAYSADPGTVAAIARQFVDAHRELGVLTAPKHFPGHGSTARDSHRVLPDISDTWREDELAPYRALIDAGAVEIVMTGHLLHPRFSDGGRMPASLSALTVDALRGELGFRGVILTDDLQMEAVLRTVGSEEEAAVAALAAGADLLMFAQHPRHDPMLVARVHAAIARAVDDGRLSVDRLIEANVRVIALKEGWLARP